MRNFLLLFFMSITSVSLSTDADETLKHRRIGTIEVMLPIPVEVIIPTLDYGLDNMKDMICFIKYLKTQSSTLTDENSKADVYFVIQTMYNRLRYNNCTWRQYYNNPGLNHSQSIKRLKSGDLKEYFNWDDVSDKELFNIAYACNLGLIDERYRLPKDILYFESFKKAPDRGPHVLVNFYTKRRHRFYRKDKLKNI